jgi:hypothetical protein
MQLDKRQRSSWLPGLLDVRQQGLVDQAQARGREVNAVIRAQIHTLPIFFELEFLKWL